MFARADDSRAQPVVFEAVAEAGDGVPDDADCVIEIADGLFYLAAHQRVYRDRCGALQMQPGREDRLDDLVLKLGGGAGWLPHDIKFAGGALGPGKFVRERHPRSPPQLARHTLGGQPRDRGLDPPAGVWPFTPGTRGHGLGR